MFEDRGQIVFINEDDGELFFSSDIKQKVPDDFVDLHLIRGNGLNISKSGNKLPSKKWILNQLDCKEIPNPDPKYQA